MSDSIFVPTTNAEKLVAGIRTIPMEVQRQRMMAAKREEEDVD
jgi:hypothetical protein